MPAALPRVLVADTAAAIPELQGAVGSDVELVAAHTLEQALRSLRERPPRVVVVGYHFDELRPFRFIAHARHHLDGSAVPIVLVSALPVHLGATTEAQVREAYCTLGVGFFVNLYGETQRYGRAGAMDRLRRLLRELAAA